MGGSCPFLAVFINEGKANKAIFFDYMTSNEFSKYLGTLYKTNKNKKINVIKTIYDFIIEQKKIYKERKSLARLYYTTEINFESNKKNFEIDYENKKIKKIKPIKGTFNGKDKIYNKVALGGVKRQKEKHVPAMSQCGVFRISPHGDTEFNSIQWINEKFYKTVYNLDNSSYFNYFLKMYQQKRRGAKIDILIRKMEEKGK